MSAPSPGADVESATALDPQNPWPGPESFRECDAALFRGRQAEIERLLRLIRRSRLTLLHGRSGLGKSSLLRAGVFPRLRRDCFLPVYLRLRHDSGFPLLIEQLRRALAAAADVAEVEAPPLLPGETLWEHLHRTGSAYWSPDNRPITPVFVLDQFEEVFTHGRRPERRALTDAFLDDLADLAEGQIPAELVERFARGEADPAAFSIRQHRYKIVLSLREDFLADLRMLRSQIPSLFEDDMRIRPLSGTAALLVTAAGGEHLVPRDVGLRIVRRVAESGSADPDVLDPDALVDETALAELEVEPALLSLFCRELNERREPEGLSQITAELVRASHASILQGFYRRSLRGLAPQVRVFVEDRLLTAGGFRNSIAEVDALEHPGITTEVLDTLVQRRLLRREERRGQPWLELTHDVLTSVLQQSADGRRAEAEVAEREEALRKARAEAAERERALQAARREAQRSRRITLVVTILLLGMVVLGMMAFAANREVRRSLAESQYLTAVQAYEAGDVQTALAWAAQAIREDPRLGPARALALSLLRDRSFPVLRLLVPGLHTAAFSEDEESVLTVSYDGTVQVRDARSGASRGPRLLQDSLVRSAAFSPDGSRVVTASMSGNAQVWDVRTGTPLTPLLPHRAAVPSVVFSPDGRRVLTASEDGTAQLWDAESGARIGDPMAHASGVFEAVFDRDGTRIVTASRDSTARVWEADSGSPLSPPLRHQGEVQRAAFSPDGHLVVTGSKDHTARVWDALSGAQRSPPLPHGGWVLGVAFSPDATSVVTASDSTARIWDSSTWGEPRTLRHPGAVLAAGYSPDGEYLVIASEDGTARLFDMPRNDAIGRAMRHADEVRRAEFARSGHRMVTAARDDTLRIWVVRRGDRLGHPVAECNGRPVTHCKAVMGAAFSPGGRRIVTASADSTARIWDVRTGTATGSPVRHAGSVRSAVFSPDGRRIVTASGDGTAQVWDARTGDTIGPPLRHPSEVWNAVFSRDGRRVVTASRDSAARIWDARTGEMIGAPLRHPAEVWHAAFSPDGRRVVTGAADNRARIWDVQRADTVGPSLPHRDWVLGADFSPEGQRVVTGSRDGTVQVWVVPGGGKLGRAMRHDSTVWSVAFAPDGARIVTASADHKARIWDARSGALLGLPLEHDGSVRKAAFSSDGQQVVTASHDGTAPVWDVGTGNARDAETIAGLAEAVAGYRVDSATGVLIPVDSPTLLAPLLARARSTRYARAGSFDEFLRRFFQVGDPPS